MAFGLSLAACNTVPAPATALKAPMVDRVAAQPLASVGCRKVPTEEHRAWSNCMIGHVPRKIHPGYEMETTLDNYMKP